MSLPTCMKSVCIPYLYVYELLCDLHRSHHMLAGSSISKSSLLTSTMPPRHTVDVQRPAEGQNDTEPAEGDATLSAPLPEEQIEGGKSQTAAREPYEGNAVGNKD